MSISSIVTMGYDVFAGEAPDAADDIYMPEVLNQKAVYWPPIGNDNYARPKLGSPVQIERCRWDATTTKYVDEKGREQISKSQVMADRDLLTGGVLWLGLVEDAADVPLENDGAAEIKRFDKNPDFDGLLFVRIAYL